MLSAGPISHNSIQLLIINTDVAALPNFLDMSFSFVLYFLRVLSLETIFLLNFEVSSCFRGPC